MSQIILEKLSIVHFKGIQSLTIAFDRNAQNIWGANGTGKTSIADAFHWLLFGKNSLGEADFGIKPLDNNNIKLEKTEVEVTGVIDFNGRRITLRHVFKEVWRKKKGSPEETLEGNTHDYYVDGAPYTLSEYKAFINKLVDETVFPLITNPLHFNRLPWQKRRETLLSVSGDISNADLARAHPEFAPLIESLLNKTLSKYKQEVVANKKLCKDDLEGIPNRIDEVRRGLPEVEDYEAIKAQIADRNETLAKLDEEIENITKGAEKHTQAIRDHQAKIRGLKLDQDQVAGTIRSQRKTQEAEDGRELKQKRTALEQATRDVTNFQNTIDSANSSRTVVLGQMKLGREKWKSINAEVLEFGEDAFKCPACKQDLPEGDIETMRDELQKNFNQDKADRLKLNQDMGVSLKTRLTQIDDNITRTTSFLETRNLEYDTLVEEIRVLETAAGVPQEEKPDIEDVVRADPKWIEIGKKIAVLEAAAPVENKIDLSEQKLTKQGINIELDSLKKKLTVKDQRAKGEARIEDLKKQEITLARELDRLEGIEFLIEKFTKTKIDALTDRINDRFKIVRFKMFNYLQNGGVEETCEVMVDGVPYSDLNTAKRMNAGIDVINVLSAHYDVTAPIIIDNRESIVDIIETNSQVINLIVREGVAPLHVGKNPPAIKVRQEALAI